MRPLCLVAVTAVLLAGCEAEGGKPAAPRDKGSADVELTEATAADVDRAVREHKGSVVVVDIWATWCAPCVERFPHQVALHRKYADLGLVCISASIDKPRESDAAREFLARHRAAFPNFLVSDPGTPEGRRVLVERFGYNGAIPFIAVFDRDGQRVWAGNGSQMPPPMLDALINREISRKPSGEGR
jgi:thiol-disulfide isomerase/thioredoxin